MFRFFTAVCFTLLCIASAHAQVADNFNDGNFTANPAWVGNAADWTVNTDLQLQSNNTVVNGSFYLSTANTLATATQWEMYVKIGFNPSSANYIDAYLTASASDISNANTTGYFVRIGNTQDEISLYRKDINGVATKIIDGVDGVLDNSTNTMKIKVIRTSASQWTLFRDLTGTGNSYVSEGAVTDATYTTSAYFGFLVKQSVASFFQKHMFDDIVIAPYVPDVTPPVIQSATALSPVTVDVLFNEPVDPATSQTTVNYVANNNIGNPVSAVRDATNSSLVHLTFGSNFPNGATNNLTINGVKDLAGNAIANGTTTFNFTVVPLAIQSVTAISANSADVLFNKAVDPATSQSLTNYSVNNSIGNPVSATKDASNTSLVHLTFATNFPNGLNNTITISGVKDLFGYTMATGTATFSFYIPQRYDIVIDEIFADPTPVIALPNAEYVELKNTSTQSINLQGWRLSSLSTTSAAFPSYLLPAGGYLIITSTTNAPLFTSYGPVIGITSFPALIDGGTTLTLVSKENKAIHSVSYSTTWYQNDVKSNGGWSLEMIDTKNPCSGATNWKASTDARGGTPGAKNSIDGSNADQIAPALLRAAATDNVTLLLNFDEPLDSLKAATASNYSISDGIGSPVSAVTVSPTFNSVQLKLSNPLAAGKVYTITATNVTDCSGNVVQARNTTRVGLPAVIDSFGIVLNEILFNPKSGGVDYVEIYNRSNKVYNLKDLYIATRSAINSNAFASIAQITTDNILIFPGDFFVISDNVSIVQQQFVAKNTDNFINVNLPSFNDDKGIAVLLNAQGTVVDELQYDAKWQFSLLNNVEGISLERIDYNKPTQNKDNWHSAASTVGYGTPGYQNSQYRSDLQLQGEVTVTPKIFSPDNDGLDDFTFVNVQMSDPTYVANITVFDATGRPVKALAKNATLGSTGTFRWDGFDEKLHKVPVGTYIIYTDVFNLNGARKTFKNTVIVAAKF